jgi:hypothetical protein
MIEDLEAVLKLCSINPHSRAGAKRGVERRGIPLPATHRSKGVKS